MGYILSLFTYLLTTSVSGRVPGYPSYYLAGTRVINYPDTAALAEAHETWRKYLTSIMACNVAKCPCSGLLHTGIKFLQADDKSIQCATVNDRLCQLRRVLCYSSQDESSRFLVEPLHKVNSLFNTTASADLHFQKYKQWLLLQLQRHNGFAF